LFLFLFCFVLKLCSATLIAPHSCCKGFLGSPLFLSWLTNHSFSLLFLYIHVVSLFCSVR
jgi:hypothetical protein